MSGWQDSATWGRRAHSVVRSSAPVSASTSTAHAMERLGFFVCDRDLEDELIRSLGVEAVEEIFAAHGKLGSFRTYQKQPAHRGRPTEEQLRGFLTNWKISLAAPLVEALDLDRVPRPLDGVLAHLAR